MCKEKCAEIQVHEPLSQLQPQNACIQHHEDYLRQLLAAELLKTQEPRTLTVKFKLANEFPSVDTLHEDNPLCRSLLDPILNAPSLPPHSEISRLAVSILLHSSVRAKKSPKSISYSNSLQKNCSQRGSPRISSPRSPYQTIFLCYEDERLCRLRIQNLILRSPLLFIKYILLRWSNGGRSGEAQF